MPRKQPPIVEIQNRSFKHLRIDLPDKATQGDGQNRTAFSILLAPLERRRISELTPVTSADLEARSEELRRYELLNLLAVIRDAKDGADVSVMGYVGVVWIYSILIYLGYTLIQGHDIGVLAWWTGITVAISGIVLFAANRHKGDFIRQTFSTVALVTVLLIAIGVPLACSYFLVDGSELFFDDNPDVGGTPDRPADLSVMRIGRLLQVSWIIIAAVIPALLYYLFDRDRLSTLRDEFYRQISRLDPEVETLTDVHAKYGRKLEEVYGADATGGAQRLQPGTLWPVLVCTLVLTIAWLIVLVPSTVNLVLTNPSELYKFFTPEDRAPAYAFLGAYFVSMGGLVRRYARGDLKPKAYTAVCARIISVVILAWVLQLVLPESPAEALNAQLTLAFIIGIFPNVGLRFIADQVKQRLSISGSKLSELDDLLPLTLLEGVDLYDRSRLEDEGIVNLQGLAHYDLVQLLLNTRLPAPQLIDWVDQSILLLHLTKVRPPEAGDRAENIVGFVSKDDVAILRQYSIRTASDLLEVYVAAKSRGPDHEEAFMSLLGAGQHPPLKPMQVMIDTLEGDEWLANIFHWRASKFASQDTVYIEVPDPASGRATVKVEHPPVRKGSLPLLTRSPGEPPSIVQLMQEIATSETVVVATNGHKVAP